MKLDDLLEAISKLPLKQTLAFLFGKGVYDVSKRGFESIRNVIRDKVNKETFGFVPNKDECNVLEKVFEKRYYKEFGYLLGASHERNLWALAQ
jgi:hypothetical protein